MSEPVMIGEFSIDPTTIPEPPSLPTNQDLVLEIVKAERKEKESENGSGRSVRVRLGLRAVDLPGAPLANATLWVTEKFKGKAHRSLARFYETLEIPYTTKSTDLPSVRFVGRVIEDKNGYFELSAVVGK